MVAQALLPGDAVRLVAATSLVVLVVADEAIGAALFLLVLGGTMVPRAVGASAALDVACGASLVLAGWASHLDWYTSVSWLDLAVHVVCTGLLAMLAVLVLRHVSQRRERAEGHGAVRAVSRGSTETVLLVGGLGAILAILWEVGEWAGHTFLDESIGVGYNDTVSDLVAGLAGSLAAGVVVARSNR